MDVPLFWKIPTWLVAVFIGVAIAGLVMAIMVPTLGYLPRWLPWPLILTCIGLTYWVLAIAERRQVH